MNLSNSSFFSLSLVLGITKGIRMLSLLKELGQEELTEGQVRLLRDIFYERLGDMEPGFLIDMAECALDIPEVVETLRSLC